MIITIDGPSASGKSTVARALAERLGFYYLYTGLLYRATAFVALRKLNKSIEELPDLEDVGFISEIIYEYEDGEPRLLFRGEDITPTLRDKEFSKASSIISANKNVRNALLSLQRSIAKKHDIVADGRDCGSVVFPNADYKFFLTASLEVRARRALHDEERKSENLSIEDVKEMISARDKRDSQREISPLRVPDGAITIDNSDLDIAQTIKLFLKHINFN